LTITIRAVGQASKRGVIPRLPSGERLLAEIDAWLPDAASETLRRGPVDADLLPTGTTTSEIRLHPAARDVRIETTDGGRVIVIGQTSPVGPGYHTYVCGLLRRMGDELGITWAPTGEPGDEDASRDITGFLHTAGRADAEGGHLAWLHRSLLAAEEAHRRGASGIHLETPPDVRFTFSGVLATVLGPRSEEWLERAIADPRVAADVWPWVADAMDARYLLGRALTLLWLEVRWRPPSGTHEQALLDEVLALLRRAYSLDPSLPFPWAAWREALTLRDQADPTTHQLVDGMAANAELEPEIGYRRGPVTIFHQGWALDVPGTFSEHRAIEEWTDGEARRSVTIAATETGLGGEPMTADEFLDQVAGHLGSDALEHEDGPVRGRARLSTETSSGIEVATVVGYSESRGLGAAIRVVIEDPQDWKWALDTWRDLRPA
jgi:hypothetical protein